MQTRAQNREGQPVLPMSIETAPLAPTSGPVTPSTQSLSASDMHTPSTSSQMPLRSSNIDDPHRAFLSEGPAPLSSNPPHSLMPPPQQPSTNFSPELFVNNPSALSPYDSHLAHTPVVQRDPQYQTCINNNYFTSYPQGYPSAPYHRGPYTRTSSYAYTASDADDMYDSDVQLGDATDVSDAGTSAKKGKVPRPPNAWILYRSEMLREIGKGRYPEGFDEAMADSGVGNGHSSSGEDASRNKLPTPPTSASSEAGVKVERKADKGEMPPPPAPVKMKKGKKGSKDPSQGLLNLGSGKTGRGIPQADISKLISIMWKREKADIRAVYEGKAEAKKAEVSELKNRVPHFGE